MEVRAEEPWSWMLYADGDRLILDVVCHSGPGWYTRAVELDGDQRARHRSEGRGVLDDLAAAVRSTAHLPDDGPPRGVDTDRRVRAAALRWRAAHDPAHPPSA